MAGVVLQGKLEMTCSEQKCTPPACQYDSKVEKKGWRGPEVAFGLAYSLVQPGQSILDIGIGTGLGSQLFQKAGLRIYGMDLSADMLDACRAKNFTAGLLQHDLLLAPYPFADASMDHILSVGVLNHFPRLGVVFSEASRIVRDEGTFCFMVLDRPAEGPSEWTFHPDPSRADVVVTLYRHSRQEVHSLLGGDFILLKSVEFTVYLTEGRTNAVPAVVYLAQRNRRIG